MEPKASIVITAFDRKKSLIRLLNALDQQSISSNAFEVIIADDSADENIAEKAIKHVNTSFDTSIVKTGLPYEINGVSVGRNLAISAAKGRIIISIDDDCLPNSYFVEEHVSYHDRGYPFVLLGHRSENFKKLNEIRPISVNEEKSISELISGAADMLNFTNFMTGNLSFPKDVIMKAGFFDESFAQPGEHGWEDIELGYRIWRLGFPMLFARNALVCRPPTEKEKEEKRSTTKAYEKASQRFIRLHPLMPWVNQFLQANQQNQLKVAEEVGLKILKEDHENVGVLIGLGEILIKKGDLLNASNFLFKALEIQSNNPRVHEKLGEILYHQGKYLEALKYFSEALKLEKRRTRSLYYIASLKRHFQGNGHSCNPVLNRDINIELGGGIFPMKLRGIGKDDIINVDTLNWPSVDVLADFKKPLPFPDSSIGQIFSIDLIQHLPYRSLPAFILECYRILERGGKLILSCPNFEAIINLYDKSCDCVINVSADQRCPRCSGNALIAKEYWRENLLGSQRDYGDGGLRETNRNQITFPYLEALLEDIGFKSIVRESNDAFYADHEKMIKLSVSCLRP